MKNESRKGGGEGGGGGGRGFFLTKGEDDAEEWKGLGGGEGERKEGNALRSRAPGFLGTVLFFFSFFFFKCGKKHDLCRVFFGLFCC